MTPEEMAASLTDSVYSTDSLDEPLTGSSAVSAGADTASSGGHVSTAVASLQKQINESLLAISIILAEKG